MSGTGGIGRPKPWERQVPAEVTSSPGAESAAKPWEVPRDSSNIETVVPESTAGPLQQPGSRPWETRGTPSTTVAGNTGYGRGSLYSTGGYGSLYGNSSGYGYGGGGMYGTSGYGYGGGGMYGNSGMYGGGMYGSSGYYGARPMFGGVGPMYGGPGPVMDGASSPWQSMLGGIGSMVHFFGRLSFLVDENAHAVHFFISALLQLLDRFGSLYGELARFILRMLGIRGKDAGNQQEVLQEGSSKRVGNMSSVWNGTNQ